MKLVIEIPDDEYQRWTTEGEMDAFIARNAMVNGTPLPKGHGRLIDADALYEQYVYADYNFDMTMEYAPTIIEADKEKVRIGMTCEQCKYHSYIDNTHFCDSRNHKRKTVRISPEDAQKDMECYWADKEQRRDKK